MFSILQVCESIARALRWLQISFSYFFSLIRRVLYGGVSVDDVPPKLLVSMLMLVGGTAVHSEGRCEAPA